MTSSDQQPRAPLNRGESSRDSQKPSPPEEARLDLEGLSGLADYIRDEVCCPRIHGCEINGADECPAERVRALLSHTKALEDRVKELEGALNAVIFHFEDGECHDEGAFDPDCPDCVVLRAARAVFTPAGLSALKEQRDE